jgi:dolichyl-phosphate-mannose--protein O-mannosyl transferase
MLCRARGMNATAKPGGARGFHRRQNGLCHAAMADALPRHRPLLIASLLGLVAEALFIFRLAVPHKLVFDEVYYVPAARALWALSGPINIEHPLVAKELIGLGIRLFGDNSFGWRFLSTIAASAVVMGVFAIGWLTFGKIRPAVFAALFTMLDITVFIQARIAMLDGFMAGFLILAIAAMLWSMRGPNWVRGKLALAAVLLGLSAGAKWTAVPYLGFAGLAFVAIRVRDARAAGRDLESVLYARDQPHWPGLALLPAMLNLGVLSIVTYLATFAPAFFYHFDPLTPAKLLPFQAIMYAQQTQVLPPHTYQSSWWSWPLDMRPIWYLYERVDGAQRGILMLGNPAVIWGGLIALLACVYGWWRDGSARLGGIAALWIASLAIWAIIPKSIGFYYYYYPASIVLSLALAAAFDHFARLRERRCDVYFLALTAGLFAYFYPIIAATPTFATSPTEQTTQNDTQPSSNCRQPFSRRSR